MMKYALRIDPEFKALIPPLTVEERELLQENLISDGCREPLSVWNGLILDGHNRYEICMRNNIDFNIVNISVSSRDEAIIWICRNQMGRRNLSEERKKYLIGKQFEAEKRIGAHNENGVNQYSEVRPTLLGEPLPESRNKTAERLGERYNISHATVEKYAKYSRAVDRIQEASKPFAETILSGEVRISHENALAVSSLSDNQISEIAETVTENHAKSVSSNLIKNTVGIVDIPKPRPKERTPQTIKDMPAHDPDSGIAALIYTIPSWRYSIDRVRNTDDYPSSLSETAKEKFKAELINLKKLIVECLREIGGSMK